jgi:LysM repeat protein
VVTVRSGDTLYGIATTHGVTIAQLQDWNSLTGSRLSIGQKLRVAEPATPARVRASASAAVSEADAPRDNSRTVKVKSGDTLFAIAQANRTTVAALARANNLQPGGTIRPGQTLRLP